MITGLTFLNMSFFIAEVTLLNIDKTDQSIQNVIQILLAGGFEEESETPDGHGKSESIKDVFLSIQANLFHHRHLFQIAQHRFGALNDMIPHRGHAQIFSPPPEA
jgi:hypothetical protein